MTRDVEGSAHIHDLQVTLLQVLEVEYPKLTFKFQGRDFRLTDVHGRSGS